MIELFRRRMRITGMLAITAFICVSAFAQTAAVPPTAAPAFEVATIKLNNTVSTNTDSDSDTARFTATNESLKSLIEYDAYDIPASRIIGATGWMDSVRFDVTATVDPAVVEQNKKLDHTQANVQFQQMIQNLLADRFKLAVHWETRNLPVYAIVVSKSGAKLQPTTSPSGSSTSKRGNLLTAKGVDMARLAQVLTRIASSDLGRVVVDKTGLAGRYDFTLKWTPDFGQSSAAATDPADSGPSIFTAVQEQLGLKLESTKAPVQVLVIDHAEMPSAN
jgi:uncharacterized protein (TIGR03435 family)